MLHIAAATQVQLHTQSRVYDQRMLHTAKAKAKAKAKSETNMEAIRCLKRRISDAIYRQQVADARAAQNQGVGTGPGGHCGRRTAPRPAQ